MLLFGSVFLGCALIVIAFARPMMLRRVPPNRIYGVKLQATFADEWVWYEANAAGGRDAMCWAAVQIAAVLIPPLFLRPASWTSMDLDRAGVAYLVINLSVLVLGALIMCMISVVRANRLLKQRIASGAQLVPKPPGH
jgi:hypothetical protein